MEAANASVDVPLKSSMKVSMKASTKAYKDRWNLIRKLPWKPFPWKLFPWTSSDRACVRDDR